MEGLEKDFNRQFTLQCGDDASLSLANTKLRYQVWCVENDYFPTSSYGDGRESDEYDYRSLYVVLSSRVRDLDIATARVILHDGSNDNARFPVEKFVMLRRHDRDAFWDVRRELVGEISRFCVSKVFRRRAKELSTIHGISSEGSRLSGGKRSFSHITLGLFKGLIEVSLAAKLEFWYALMEPSLLKMLKIYGVHFTAIGPQVNYFGIRQPCMASIESVLEGIRRNSDEIGDFVCPSHVPPYGEPSTDPLSALRKH